MKKIKKYFTLSNIWGAFVVSLFISCGFAVGFSAYDENFENISCVPEWGVCASILGFLACTCFIIAAIYRDNCD